jgi:hypothetical protein
LALRGNVPSPRVRGEGRVRGKVVIHFHDSQYDSAKQLLLRELELTAFPGRIRFREFRCRVRLRTDCRIVRKRTLRQLQFPVACHGDQ